MRKVVLLLTTAVMLVTMLLASLALAPAKPASAHHGKGGNWIVCPKGTLQNAGGTTCTDKKTGKWVEPKRQHVAFPKQYPCPELWKLKKNGNGCKKDKKIIRRIRDLPRKPPKS